MALATLRLYRQALHRSASVARFDGHAVTSKRVLLAHKAGRTNQEGTEHVKCVQGYRVHLEIWKVLLEDCRWVGMSGPLDPTNFNPSRSTMLSFTFHCF